MTTNSPAPARSSSRFGCFTALGFVTAGFLALIAVFAVVIFGATAAPVSAANAFFKTAARDGASAAYATTAPLFRTVTSQSGFETVAQTANLQGVQSATWNSRGILNGVARLSGHLHYEGGNAQPVAVQLAKVDGRWRMLWLDVGPNAVAALAATDANARSTTLNGSTTGATPQASGGSTPVGLSGPGVPPPPSASLDPSRPTIDLEGARTLLADGTPALRGSAIGAFCRQLFQEARQIRYDRIDCPISLAMTVGATTRCVAYWDQHSVGMTATFQGQNGPKISGVYCKADDQAIS